MKKKFAFAIYRKWAFEVFKNISAHCQINNNFDLNVLITTKEREFPIDEAKRYAKVEILEGNDNERIHAILKENEVDAILFYGWSWIVKENVLNDFLCLCLHPSPLPRYRGGTPLQHQVINGEKESAVSVFKMSKGIDSGDIYMQLPMSLEGNIHDIFGRMTDLGTEITKTFIADFGTEKAVFTPQKDVDKYPPFRRRKTEANEIKLEELPTKSFEDIHNLVRCLLDPYPNAYMFIGSQKLTIQEVQRYEKIGEEDVVISSAMNSIDMSKNCFLKLPDCYVKLVKYKLENLGEEKLHT